MKTTLWIAACAGLLSLTLPQAHAQGPNRAFYRLSAFSGAITLPKSEILSWSNSIPNQTVQVQQAYSLSSTSSWQNYVQIVSTGTLMSVWIYDQTAPPDMALIPAGRFRMGDWWESFSDNSPPACGRSLGFLRQPL